MVRNTRKNVRGQVRNHAALFILNIKLLFLRTQHSLINSHLVSHISEGHQAEIFVLHFCVGDIKSRWQGNNIINGGQIELKHGFDRGFPQCHGLTYRVLYLPPTHTHTHTHTHTDGQTHKYK